MGGWKDQSCLPGIRIPAVSPRGTLQHILGERGLGGGIVHAHARELEQTADHCRALAGLVASVSAMSARVRARLRAFPAMTMLFTFSEGARRNAQLRPKQQASIVLTNLQQRWLPSLRPAVASLVRPCWYGGPQDFARAGVSPEFWVKWALSPAFHCEGRLSFQRSSLWLTAASLYVVGRSVHRSRARTLADPVSAGTARPQGPWRRP